MSQVTEQTVRFNTTLAFFFFLAEDGIRDRTVTGVQTCALPISWRAGRGRQSPPPFALSFLRTSSCDLVNRLHPCDDCRHGATRNRRAPGSLGPRRVPREFEARHGFPGTRRASGGLGGPTNSRRVTGFPGRAERRGVWGALSRPPMR